MEWWMLIPVYVFVWLVVGVALIQRFEVIDVAASFIAALTWPVLLPVHIVRRIIR
jgi:hypothetical protein